LLVFFLISWFIGHEACDSRFVDGTVPLQKCWRFPRPQVPSTMKTVARECSRDRPPVRNKKKRGVGPPTKGIRLTAPTRRLWLSGPRLRPPKALARSATGSLGSGSVGPGTLRLWLSRLSRLWPMDIPRLARLWRNILESVNPAAQGFGLRRPGRPWTWLLPMLALQLRLDRSCSRISAVVYPVSPSCCSFDDR